MTTLEDDDFVVEVTLLESSTDSFSYDLTIAMVHVGQGHDPYNHVGSMVVREVIGA